MSIVKPKSADQIKYATPGTLYDPKTKSFTPNSKPGEFIMLRQFYPEIGPSYSMSVDGRIGNYTTLYKSSRSIADGGSHHKLAQKYDYDSTTHFKRNSSYGKSFSNKKMYREIFEVLTEIYLKEGTVGSDFFDEAIEQQLKSIESEE